MGLRQPLSVLVVVHTTDLSVLLLERRNGRSDPSELWQSVTGSVEPGELLIEAARREVFEETGLSATGLIDWHCASRFAIYPEHLHRYPAGIFHNTEHVFSLCVAADARVCLAEREHTRYRWEPWANASRLCFSWSNSAMIDRLPEKLRSQSLRMST